MSEVIGKIHLIGKTEVVGSAGTFKKRTVVVVTDEQYSQSIPIDFVQDKCDLLNNYSVGQEVKVSINIRGNEYNGKFYVSLNGWRIECTDATSANHPTNTSATNQAKPQTFAEENEQGDGLPF
jgi:hypothetical protein